ncbi:MAG: FixH family protein [Dissulfurispiraceae bacterium]
MRTLIIAIVLMGLSSVAGSIIFGIRSFDGVVVDSPYETGLSWEKVRNESAATGWHADVKNATLKTSINELVISVRDSNGHLLKDAEMSITVSRPSTKAYDMTYKAEPTDDGLYRASVSFPIYGYWDLKISILKEGRRASFEKRIFAEKG